MANKQPANKPKGPVNVQPQWLPWWRYLIWFFVIMAFSWYWSSPAQNRSQRFSYTEFKEKVRANEVTSVNLQGDRVSGNLRQIAISPEATKKKVPLRFVSTLPPVDDPE
ncbi:MAG: ATP-dependent metallopeptidase FtsH/Yme1/Tma family protein, partial [Pseudomonadota bacterium]|nr:ATP-dependent metallopeptidase FtsH/Yme1/Tma family protein [Pseudomonadota bacterium]